uniref:DUF2040 domain-containing protein n=1 Tax=Caenorhabditis tropicalis TaxID=1561998 RepID=A0A1I7TCA6_9PELO
MESPEAPDEFKKPHDKPAPKRKRALVVPLSYWRVEPTLQQLEAEIDEAIWQSAKEEDMKNERIRLAENEKLKRKDVIDAKKSEKSKEKTREKGEKIKKKNPKSIDSEALEKEKLEKLKASRKRFYEKKRAKKLEEEEKRKWEREQLLEKYNSGDF